MDRAPVPKTAVDEYYKTIAGKSEIDLYARDPMVFPVPITLVPNNQAEENLYSRVRSPYLSH